MRKRDSWKMYCNDMEFSEGQDAAWCKIRSVLDPKSVSYNYTTTTEKLETFASKLEGVFTNERQM